MIIAIQNERGTVWQLYRVILLSRPFRDRMYKVATSPQRRREVNRKMIGADEENKSIELSCYLDVLRILNTRRIVQTNTDDLEIIPEMDEMCELNE